MDITYFNSFWEHFHSIEEDQVKDLRNCVKLVTYGRAFDS